MGYRSPVSANRHGTDAPAVVAAPERELWRLDALTLIAMIRNGQISSREAVQSSLDRLAAVNPALNAVVVTMHESALAAALDADTSARTERLWVLCTAFRSP